MIVDRGSAQSKNLHLDPRHCSGLSCRHAKWARPNRNQFSSPVSDLVVTAVSVAVVAAAPDLVLTLPLEEADPLAEMEALIRVE